MKYRNMFSRWHRYDTNGVKYIKKFNVDETPNPLVEDGYTPWVRGTGKMKPEHYEKIVSNLLKISQGISKSVETKYKMRLAKLGVKKSPEHRANMRRAWEKKRVEKSRMQDIPITKQNMETCTD